MWRKMKKIWNICKLLLKKRIRRWNCLVWSSVLILMFQSQSSFAVELTGVEKFSGNNNLYLPGFFTVGSQWTASESISLVGGKTFRLLPSCLNELSTNCIESVSYKPAGISSQQSWKKGTLTNYLLSDNAYPECLGPYVFDGNDGTPTSGKVPTYN